MISKEAKANNLNCKREDKICKKCPDSQLCEDSTDKIVLDEFTVNFYKNITREQIIMALGHAQKRDVESSNKAYKLKKNTIELVKFIELEIYSAEQSAEKQTNEYFKNLFLGQKVAYERVLRQITNIKFEKEK